MVVVSNLLRHSLLFEILARPLPLHLLLRVLVYVRLEHHTLVLSLLLPRLIKINNLLPFNQLSLQVALLGAASAHVELLALCGAPAAVWESSLTLCRPKPIHALRGSNDHSGWRRVHIRLISIKAEQCGR